jgi:hypothetical protein
LRVRIRALMRSPVAAQLSTLKTCRTK